MAYFMQQTMGYCIQWDFSILEASPYEILSSFIIRVTLHGKKITPVLDSKPSKSAWHFEGNKFSVRSHQFFLEVDQNLQFWTKCSQQKAIQKQK